MTRPSLAILALLPIASTFADEVQDTLWTDSGFIITQSMAWEKPWIPGRLELDRLQSQILDSAYVGDGLVGLSLTDLDGDGDQDAFYLVHQWYNDYFLYALENMSPSQEWALRYESNGLNHPPSFDHGDIDLDGLQDIITVRRSGSACMIHAQRASAEWTWNWATDVIGTIPLTGSPLCVVDLNADGAPDIVTNYVPGLAFWRNDHEMGLFTRLSIPFDWASTLQQLETADIEPDGDQDLLVRAMPGVCVLRNISPQDLELQEEVLPESGSQNHAEFADMNGDGSLDVVTSGERIRWYEHFGGEWTPHDVADVPAGHFDVGDVNGDGYPDIVAQPPPDAEHPSPAFLLASTGPGSWELEYLASCRQEYDLVEVADLGFASGDEVALGRFWMSADSDVADSGCLISLIYDVEVPDNDWGTITWTAETPPETEIQFRVRGWDEYASNPAPWSDPITMPGTSLAPYFDDGVSVIQYMVEMRSAHGLSPSLDDVTLTYMPLGAEAGPGPAGVDLRPLANPSGQSLEVELGLPEASEATLSIYDVAGRLVCRPLDDAPLAGGVHRCVVSGLPAGAYLMRLEACGKTTVSRVVVCR
ncbi:MAG: T9SS type A sorting domain-containing protein [Candidatus Fermentibacterota bacterium]